MGWIFLILIGVLVFGIALMVLWDEFNIKHDHFAKAKAWLTANPDAVPRPTTYANIGNVMGTASEKLNQVLGDE